MVLAALAVLACAAPPGQPADPKEPTDTVLVLRVTTDPVDELIDVVITALYDEHLLKVLPADDGRPLKIYKPSPPLVTPWGYEFRLNAETPLPLQATVSIHASKNTRITCQWYKGLASTKPVWNDRGTGHVICLYLWGRDK